MQTPPLGCDRAPEAHQLASVVEGAAAHSQGGRLVLWPDEFGRAAITGAQTAEGAKEILFSKAPSTSTSLAALRKLLPSTTKFAKSSLKQSPRTILIFPKPRL